MGLLNTLFGNKLAPSLPRSDIAYIKRDGGPVLAALLVMQEEAKTMMQLAETKLPDIQSYVTESASALNEIVTVDKAVKAFNGRDHKQLDALKEERDALCKDFVQVTYDRMDNVYSGAIGDPRLPEETAHSFGNSHQKFFQAVGRLPAEYITSDIVYEMGFYNNKGKPAAPKIPVGDFTDLDRSLANVHKEHTAAIVEGKVDVHAYMEQRTQAEEQAFKEWTTAQPAGRPVVGEHTAKLAGHRSAPAAGKETVGEHTAKVAEQREQNATQAPTTHGF